MWHKEASSFLEQQQTEQALLYFGRYIKTPPSVHPPTCGRQLNQGRLQCNTALRLSVKLAGWLAGCVSTYCTSAWLAACPIMCVGSAQLIRQKNRSVCLFVLRMADGPTPSSVVYKYISSVCVAPGSREPTKPPLIISPPQIVFVSFLLFYGDFRLVYHQSHRRYFTMAYGMCMMRDFVASRRAAEQKDRRLAKPALTRYATANPLQHIQQTSSHPSIHPFMMQPALRAVDHCDH